MPNSGWVTRCRPHRQAGEETSASSGSWGDHNEDEDADVDYNGNVAGDDIDKSVLANDDYR